MRAVNPDLIGNLHPLLPYIEDEEAVELQVTEPGGIWVEKPETGAVYHEDSSLTLDYFQRLGHNLAALHKIVGYEKKPYLAVSLPGGHRLQLCTGITIKSGIAVSIRTWRPRLYTLSDYELSADQKAFLRTAIERKYNILVSGGTFSGKTTFTNALLELVPPRDRVISVEDTPELDLTHIANRSEFIVNRLATLEEIDNQEVLRAIMRLRPDRAIIGELSDNNTFLLSRILNMGHGGTISTLHAESPELAFTALTTNVEMAGMPTKGTNTVFRRNIHAIVQISRDPATYKRTVSDLWINDALPA